jgi:hypothetical protein
MPRFINARNSNTSYENIELRNDDRPIKNQLLQKIEYKI